MTAGCGLLFVFDFEAIRWAWLHAESQMHGVDEVLHGALAYAAHVFAPHPHAFGLYDFEAAVRSRISSMLRWHWYLLVM